MCYIISTQGYATIFPGEGEEISFSMSPTWEVAAGSMDTTTYEAIKVVKCDVPEGFYLFAARDSEYFENVAASVIGITMINDVEITNVQQLINALNSL